MNTSNRGPGRLPGLLQNGNSSASSITSEENGHCNGGDTSAIERLLAQRLGFPTDDQVLDHSEDGTESLLDYDPDDEDEDEVVFEDEERDTGASQNGREAHKTPECLIKTSATIVVHKKESSDSAGGEDGDRPTLQQLSSRQLLIFVPPSRMKEPLSTRFANQNQRMMKRDLTPEQRLLNYLRFKGEAGFSKAFAGTAGGKSQTGGADQTAAGEWSKAEHL